MHWPVNKRKQNLSRIVAWIETKLGEKVNTHIKIAEKSNNIDKKKSNVFGTDEREWEKGEKIRTGFLIIKKVSLYSMMLSYRF